MSFKFVQGFYSFSEKIKRNNRYILCDKSRQFLEELYEKSKDKQKSIPHEKVLWRAQLGAGSDSLRDHEGYEYGETPAPYSQERMFPLADKAREGRANPKGIPYLYLATTEKTAISEVRPWVGKEISVAQFGITRDLTIIDFSISKPIGSHTTNSCKDENVWEDIASAFSEPITSTDNESLYAPTQVIAEFFKSKGIDGIAYYSMLGEGHNIVLFETKTAVVLNCSLCEIQGVSYDFQEVAGRYSIKDPYSLNKT